MPRLPDWNQLADRSLNGAALAREEARAVLTSPDEEMLPLLAATARVRRTYFGTRVKLNFLLNVKSGLCPEDCQYCSQSRGSTAKIAKYPTLPAEKILAAAERAQAVKAKRFCIVASGRGPTDGEVEELTEAVRAVRAARPEMEICCCLGLLRDSQAERLKASGVFAYNHNLNTSERFYGEICSTHTYGDRMATLERARRAGLSPCSGALFGMGESREDILDLAYALRALRPDSIPINFLIPVEGTPLAGRTPLGPIICLKILCLIRLLNPTAEVRIAGGREVQLRWLQPFGLHVANSIFVGDYLTTRGQLPEADFALIRDLGFTIEGVGEVPDPALPSPWLPGGLGGGAGRLIEGADTPQFFA